MKRKLFTIATILLLIFSCTNDADNETVTNQTIGKEVKKRLEPTDKELVLGTWNITKVYSEEGKLTANYKQIPISMQLEITGKNYDMTVTFAEEKISNEGSFTAVANISSFVINKTVEQKVKKLPSLDSKWEVKDKQIYIEGEELPTIHFVKITKNETLVKIPLSKDLIGNNKLDMIEGISDIGISGNLFIELKRES